MKTILPFRKSLLALFLCIAPLPTFAQIGIGVGISIRVAPPVLPVYTQPPCPTPGFLWTPGYWGYGAVGYYWVPGVWVAPPRPGVLWTPGYWGFAGGLYGWHGGYWGPHVGFYGGVNYGFGYAGVGFVGGAWAGNTFRYNTAVTSVNTTVIHNTYVNRTVVNNTAINNHDSFNGPGGLNAQPTAEQRAASNEQHYQATPNQMSHQQNAAQDRNQWASANGGHPGTTAMNSVNGRRFNEQGRIAQGAASGQLNARQTQRLEGQQVRNNQQIRADRQANGGRLTPQERGQVNRQQNKESHHIYNQKHDEQRGPR